MVIKTALFCLAALVVMGCGRGIVYTNTIKPYSKSFRDTPVGGKVVVINTQTVKKPPGLGPPGISAQWDTDEIMRLAREQGITELHYIDIKTFSLLLGTYSRKSLIVYGD